MCSNYDPVTNADRMMAFFGADLVGAKHAQQVYPLGKAPFIRRHPNADVGDDAVPSREALLGQFGLLPMWAGEVAFGRKTFNARSETVHEKPSFRDAWKNRQFCIIPCEAIYEPDWRSGTSVATRITRADGHPMGVAGLWALNKQATGEEVLSFTMLTINADDHPLMRNFHRAGEEKRMVVILHEQDYDAWLDATPSTAPSFLRQYPADLLVATPDSDRGRKKRAG